MLAISGRLDEFGFVDDPVNVAVIAGEIEERGKRSPLSIEPVGGVGERRPDIVANLRRHVADERLEQRLLGIEVSVEGTQRDAGPLRNADDRAVGKAALSELIARGVEDLAQRALAACRPRSLRGPGGTKLPLVVDLDPHPAPLP